MGYDKSLVNEKIIKFDKDTTRRLSFRKDDLLFHLRPHSIYSDGVDIIDIWQLTDGQFATITNRNNDLPAWFSLHPSEVCGHLCYEYIEKFNRGEFPKSPIIGTNIWRINAGDKVCWIGESRPDLKAYNGLLNIFTFSECALLYGEPLPDNLEDAIAFGQLYNAVDNITMIKYARFALALVMAMGPPRKVSFAWQLGH